MNTVFLILPAFAGMLLSVQGAANAQLSRALRSPFAATTVQLAVGTLLLAVVAAGLQVLPALGKAAQVPWWHLMGGLASALYVIAGILLFPRLGAVTAVGLFIAGQMLASLALDAIGVLGVPRHPVSTGMVAGALLILAGVVAIVRGQVKDAPPLAPRWIALGLVAGAVLPVQGAVNAMLRAEIGAPFAVGLVSFAVATAAMGLVFAALLASGRAPAPQPCGLRELPWWGWLGGVAGAFYVTTVFVSMPVIGAASTVGLTVAGQQVASVLVDRHGWMRLPRQAPSALRLAGVCVLLLGVVTLKGLG